jgi:hypothetical protein
MNIPSCPECGSPAVASRLIFSPEIEDGPDGDVVAGGSFTYVGKACKACGYEWKPDE